MDEPFPSSQRNPNTRLAASSLAAGLRGRPRLRGRPKILMVLGQGVLGKDPIGLRERMCSPVDPRNSSNRSSGTGVHTKWDRQRVQFEDSKAAVDENQYRVQTSSDGFLCIQTVSRPDAAQSCGRNSLLAE
jgi:hypothetical protein